MSLSRCPFLSSPQSCSRSRLLVHEQEILEIDLFTINIYKYIRNIYILYINIHFIYIKICVNKSAIASAYSFTALN